MIIKCEGCKKEFVCSTRKFNYNNKNNYKIYCSKECGYKSKIKNIIVKCNLMKYIHQALFIIILLQFSVFCSKRKNRSKDS